MLKDELRISVLLASYLRGELTALETEELNRWISLSEENSGLVQQLQDKAYVQTELSRFSAVDKAALWSKVQSKLVEESITMQPVPVRLWPRILVAASISAIILASAVLYFSKKPQQEQASFSAYKNDFAPGKVGATLTLANGQKIKLSDVSSGEIAKQAGVSITKGSGGQIIYQMGSASGDQHTGTAKNILSTGMGEIYTIVLPDKSKVWLNSASSISYSAALSDHGKRRISLEGEAYFEISKDKDHPFIVESRGQQVEVLGTHFNVNTYADEPVITTTLLEGAVQVTTAGSKKRIKPGEQAINNGTNIKIALANMDNVLDWKGGDFYLNHVNFKTAMRKIARWYNVEVIYDESVPNDMESGGWISRNKPLSTVLKSMESSGLVKFRTEGRKIYVSR